MIPARVTKLIVQPGQYVKAGEPLAILSSVELGEAKPSTSKRDLSRQSVGSG